MAEDVPQSLRELGPHAVERRHARLALRHLFLLANGEDEEPGGEKAERVEDDGQRRLQHLDQHAGKCGPRELRS